MPDSLFDSDVIDSLLRFLERLTSLWGPIWIGAIIAVLLAGYLIRCWRKR